MINENPSLERRRLSLALIASIVTHVVLVLLIVFTHHDKPLPRRSPPQTMDVVMLNPNTKNLTTPPKNAHTISNRNAIGSSKNALDHFTRMARSPVIGHQRPTPKPAPPKAPRTPPPLPEPTPQQRTRTLALRDLTSNRSTPKKRRPRKPKPNHPPLPKVPLADLMPSDMALAELSRDFDREHRLKERENKEADIPINTRQAKFAPYAQQLVQALEAQWQPGQANYGAYSTRDRQVLLRVTIEGNGNLGNVEILRPSPIQQLNDSAVAAVHDAAPFRRLPSSWGLDSVRFYLTFEIVDNRFSLHATY